MTTEFTGMNFLECDCNCQNCPPHIRDTCYDDYEAIANEYRISDNSPTPAGQGPIPELHDGNYWRKDG